MPFTVVFEYPTIRQLAAHILYLLNTPSAAPIGVAAEDESETGPTLGALAEAAARAEGAGAAREADDSPAAGGGESVLLSAAAKAGGVPCAPAQMHFVTLQLVGLGSCSCPLCVHRDNCSRGPSLYQSLCPHPLWSFSVHRQPTADPTVSLLSPWLATFWCCRAASAQRVSVRVTGGPMGHMHATCPGALH